MNVTLACASINVTPCAWDKNLAQIQNAISEAKAIGASLLVTPRLVLSGVSCKDWFFSKSFVQTAWHYLESQVVPLTKGIVVTVGLPVWIQDRVYEGVALVVDKEILGLQLNTHVEARFQRWFRSWAVDNAFRSNNGGGGDIPVGDLEFNLGGQTMAIVMGDMPIRENFAALDLILSPAALAYQRHLSQAHRETLQQRSQQILTPILFANVLGNDGGGLIFEGGSAILKDGGFLALDNRLSFKDVSVVSAEVTMSVGVSVGGGRRAKASSPSLSDEKQTPHHLAYLDKSDLSDPSNPSTMAGQLGVADQSSKPGNWNQSDHLNHLENRRQAVYAEFLWPKNGASGSNQSSVEDEVGNETSGELVEEIDANNSEKMVAEVTVEVPGKVADEAWVSSPYVAYEGFSRSVALGLWDHMRKTRTKGYALSLSGGADSGTCAALVYLMVYFALSDLGVKGVKAALSYIEALQSLDVLDPGAEDEAVEPISPNKQVEQVKHVEEVAQAKIAPVTPVASTEHRSESESVKSSVNLLKETHQEAFLSDKQQQVKQLMRLLLLCVYQGTPQSSQVTRTAATEVAKALGARFYSIEIGPIVEAYRALVEQARGQNFDWETDDITLQNIQARTRLPSIWMFANAEQRLLIATGNRSECAVGYATMDGDTAGGIAPISGVDKHFIRGYLKWLDEVGVSVPEGSLRLPSLRYIHVQAPTAELRPGGQQTDENDLMPYEVLQQIEALVVVQHRAEDEVVALLKESYPTPKLLEWVAKFFRRFRHGQWKRERYAPGFGVDVYCLDDKSAQYPLF